MKQFFNILLLAVALSLGVMLMLKWASPQRTGGGGGLQPGDSAPPIEAAGWVNDEPPDLQGQVVVVDAWATWCGPCRKAAPHLVEIYRKYRDQGVVFIGLTAESREALPQIRQFLEQTGISWPNGYGAEKTLSRFGVKFIPAYWVIGPDGQIVWNRASGPLEDGIEKALARRES